MTLSKGTPCKWELSFTKTAEKQFEKLDPFVRKSINRYIFKHLIGSQNPRYFGKPLQGTAEEYWRFRVGDYRLVCEIHDHILTVFVVRVAHRRDVYKKLHLIHSSS
jgi:mRNA interferase RelE/StbE